MKKSTWVTLGIIALAIIGGYFVYSSSHPKAQPSLASVRATEAPWAPELDHLKERLAAIGLPALSAEGTALHTHEHLDIFVHGKPVAIPADIGIHDAYPQFISPIHVHDETGILHVESPTVGKFTLGQFFDIWGVRLTPTCLGAYCADAADSLAVYVNGQKYQDNPRDIELIEHEEIAIVYGTATETPATIPASYAFPQGY